MKISLFIAAFIAMATVPSVKSDYLGLNPQGMPIFTIDLDMEPRERFKEVTTHFAEQYKLAEHTYLGLASPTLRAFVHLFAEAMWHTKPVHREEI